jgi:hypothetical protein
MTATVVLRHKDSNYTVVQLATDVSIFNELPIFDVFGLSTASDACWSKISQLQIVAGVAIAA